MNFIGQEKIVLELNAIIKNRPKYVNILFRASAGMGKTKLANEFLLESCRNYTFQTPEKRNGYRIYWYDKSREYRGHFIDEIHNLKSIETLYPLMDKKSFYFVFATNEYGDLPEAFISRCFVYNFVPYTLDEIIEILLLYGVEKNFTISRGTAEIIANRCRNNPRVAKNYLDRINILIDSGYHKKTERGIITAFNDIGIYKGGYTTNDIRYLQYLEKIGTASLSTISRGISVDEHTIKNEVEPFLVNNGHIIINSRGRKFISFEQQGEF